MALKVYRDAPFNTGNEVDPPDTYVGDGSTTTFNLSQKTIDELGQTITFGNIQYYQYTGGFTKTASGFTLSSAPFAGTQGVAPGLNSILFDNIYDADTVDGISTPRVQEIPFYLADISTIHLYSYPALPASSGIALSLVDNITSYGAQTSWIQLTSATNDGPGTALGYLATGSTLYTPPITAFGLLTASAAAGASSIFVDTASTFVIGDYVLINTGNSTQEIQKVISYVAPTRLNLAATLNFNHLAAEGVWTCGRKFWMKCTMPSGATGGEPASFYDLALRSRYARRSRL